MNIIEALKKNEKVYNCMNEELRSYMFESVCDGEGPEKIDFQTPLRGGGWEKNTDPYFYGEKTYRLRPDYKAPEAKPKIMECEVMPNNAGILRFCYQDEWYDLSDAFKFEAWDGFKYEDDRFKLVKVIVSASPKMFMDNNGFTFLMLNELAFDDCNILTPTKVLFRKATK